MASQFVKSRLSGAQILSEQGNTPLGVVSENITLGGQLLPVPIDDKELKKEY